MLHAGCIPVAETIFRHASYSGFTRVFLWQSTCRNNAEEPGWQTASNMWIHRLRYGVAAPYRIAFIAGGLLLCAGNARIRH
ncbi:hypothetical protein AABM17_555 [Neisseria musculi]|uniref:Uncharacterized protein n=1 Tax=Neisseria musculi TaxID=1815583 RepID=A0A7H1MFI6_9NEIS|nr:hypothetical protein H7A79_0555 [Neisseria musculi]